MEKNMKHIDNLFKDELGSYAETPPPPAWDALEKRLKESRKKRAFPYRWLWYISIVSFVVLLGASVLWKMTGNANTNSVASTDNAMSAQTHAIATTTTSNYNDRATETNIADKKHTKQHHHKNTTSITNSNETTKIANHRSNKRKANEQINTTQNSKSRTNDDLYADTDDDQYTVGYSSSTRRNVTSVENEMHTPDYAMQQRSQDNIIVAETDPDEQVHENNYGSRPSVSPKREMPQQTTNIAHQHNATSSKEYAGDNTNTINNDHTHSRHHRSHTTITGSTMTHNADKPAANETSSTTAYIKKTPKAKSEKAVPVNVVAASTPVIKVDVAKQVAAIAPVKKNKHKHAGIINTQRGIPGIGSEGSIASSTTTAKTKKAKPVAVTVPANEPAKATSSQISTKKTTSENTTTSSVHAIKAKTPKVLVAKTTANEHVQELAQNKSHNINTKTILPGNSIASSTPVIKTKAADKNEVVLNKKKKDVNTALVQNKKDKVGMDANVPIVANTAAVSVNKHHKQKKDVIKDNSAGGAVVNNAVPGSDMKITKGPVAHHKAKAQKDIMPAATNILAANNNRATSSKNTVVKHKPATDKQLKVKAGKQVDVVAANTTINHLVKDKHLQSDKIANKTDNEVATVNENNTTKTKQLKKTGKADKKALAEQLAIAKNENKGGKKETTKKRQGNKNTVANTPPATPPPAFVYNNAISKRNLEDETVIIDNLKVNNATDPRTYASSNDGEMIPGTFKQDALKPSKSDSTVANAGIATDSTGKHSMFSRHFEAGIKGGYETAFTKGGANKFVVSPYIQYNLTDKFSIMTQPSLKVSHLGNISLDGTKSYVDPKTGSITPLDSGVVVVVPGGPGFYLRRYTYTQIYDSIVKSYGLSHTYMEFEMPLLAKYKIYKQLSVYGGVNIVFGKEISIAENTYTSGPLTTSRIGGTLSSVGAPPTPEPPVSSVIKYPNPLISSYAGPLYPSPSGDLLRLGYMLGFSYEYKKRWLFDVLIQQATAKANNEGGVNTNAPLSLPYFRFTLGYKLTK